jgi:hypothetical protein
MAVFAWLSGWCLAEKNYVLPPKRNGGLSYVDSGGGKKLVLFIRKNEAGTISVKVSCASRANLAWLEAGYLNFKDSTINPYLIGLIEQLPGGRNIRFLPNWSPSPNGATNYGYSTHYEGWLKLGSNDEALRFLANYFEIRYCND